MPREVAHRFNPDGAAGAVARTVVPNRRRPTLVAVESLAPMPPEQAPRFQGRILVDFGNFPGGYAWAFPKGDRVNVGVMLEYSRGRDLRRALEAFVAGVPDLPPGAAMGRRGAPVAAPQSDPMPCASKGVLLVGDAARLADPFLGEGIYYAIRSGSLAAAALLARGDGADPAARYEAAIAQAIWPDLRAAARIASLFHRMPRWWHRLLSRMPASLLQHVAVLTGEQSYTGLLRLVVERLESAAGGWVLRRLGFGQTGSLMRERS